MIKIKFPRKIKKEKKKEIKKAFNIFEFKTMKQALMENGLDNLMEENDDKVIQKNT